MDLVQAVPQTRVRRASPVRVLVAEDDPEMRALLVQELEKDGYEVLAVGGTAEAELEMLIAAHAGRGQLPAVIVTDRRMPDGDGLDLVADLRRNHWWIPVVVVTAFADADVWKRARMLGCCRVLAKPVEMDLVRLAVRESLTP
jgi:CheY-like chemotaxis protein